MPGSDGDSLRLGVRVARLQEGERRVTAHYPGFETTSLRRNPKIEEAPLQGELMLFDPTSSKFFVMNPTMAFLWRKCDGGQPLSAIVESLSSEFTDVDSIVAEAELRKALDELVALGLLIREPGEIAGE
jgi:hypothetical protein